MDDDRRRWDDRYLDAGPPAARPPDAVSAAGRVDDVPTAGRALDVACGTGAVALWAAARGLATIALDVSGVAIQLLSNAAAEAKLDVDAQRVDLDDGLPEDLGLFELVVCQRFRDRDLISALPALVAPGGWLVVTVLSEVDAEAPGPFHAPAGELAELLPVGEAGWSLVADVEAAGEASVVLRRLPTSDDPDPSAETGAPS